MALERVDGRFAAGANMSMGKARTRQAQAILIDCNSEAVSRFCSRSPGKRVK